MRELRAGVTADGRTTIKSPSATLSTAEAISVVTSGLSLAAHFGDGAVRADDVAAGLLGAVVKDPVQDAVVWEEYLETVVRNRPEWADLYRACRDLETTEGSGARQSTFSEFAITGQARPVRSRMRSTSSRRPWR